MVNTVTPRESAGSSGAATPTAKRSTTPRVKKNRGTKKVKAAGDAASLRAAAEAAMNGKVPATAQEAENHVTALLEANGLSRDDFLKRPDQIEYIELFQVPKYRRLLCFDRMINLRQLEVMEQGITSMEGLSACKNLKKIWFSNNKIDKISGLAECTALTHLHLDMNRITVIEGLETLVNLEVLSLHTNKISKIQGLDTLTKLKHLHLADNKIESIGGSIDKLTQLEELNLSANQLSSFQEIRQLSKLKNAQVLYLNDPHFGDNPVCNLCNYHTYALYHLQHLEVLDTIRLSDDATQLAEATFLKKQMYYNMRIKMCKRNTTNVIRKANELCQKKIAKVSSQKQEIVKQMKAIEREIGEQKNPPPASPPNVAEGDSKPEQYPASALAAKRDKIVQALTQLEKHVEQIQDLFTKFQHRVSSVSEELVARMIVELERGGNIRFEDGQPHDSWYQSCDHFLKSHFGSKDHYAKFGITDIRVRRVTKVHNRYLRNRFEGKLENLPQFDPTNDNRQKPDLQYLFYMGSHQELAAIAEVGIKSESREETAVVLTNSIAHTDHDRVIELSKQPGYSSLPAITGGMLMICKVYLGTVLKKPTDESGPPHAPPSTLYKKDYVKCDTVREELRPLGNATDLSDSSDKSSKATKPGRWYIFDRDMIIPEYLVSFEYIRKTLDLTEDVTINDQPDVDLTKVLGNFLGLQDPLIDFYRTWRRADQTRDISKKVLALTPVIPSRPQNGFMTPNEAPTQTSQPLTPAQRAALTYLNLHANNIRQIKGLNDCTNLTTLILCFNSIQKIEGLSALTQLRHLDLSYNSIKRASGLEGLANLKVLDLSHNSIHTVKDLRPLQESIPQLEDFTCQGNPIALRSKSYRPDVLQIFQLLKQLDNMKITPEMRREAIASSNLMTEDMLTEHAFLDKDSYSTSTKNALSRRMTAPLSVYTRVKVSDILRECTSELNWKEMVVEIELDHQRLGKIQHMEGLSNLRKASFCDNELQKIEGLNQNVKLEELCLEENKITAIENLSNLTRLSKLDIGKNQLTTIENISMLEKLSQLSLEDNLITSLKGLECLSSLMELYIGNNRISDLKEINHIRELPRLLIVDLSGNPICKMEPYRLYVIFHVKKLKVLDGTGISSVEQNQAKEQHSGKLTEDLLAEILGHNYYKHIENLDLSASRLRSMEVVNAERFCALRVLVLDNNHISDVTSLRPLALLRVLRLNKNRVQSIPADDAGRGHLGKCFPLLEVLELGNNRITSIQSLNLKGLSQLRVLTLEANEIHRIDGLFGLGNLQQLVLAKNKIKRIDPKSFSCVPDLRGLQLEENGLRSLANLGPLLKLRSLFLAYNRLGELNELEHLSPERTCPAVTEITLRNNPLARKHLYRSTLIRKMPALQVIDGREVSIEEKEKIESLFTASEQPFANSPLYYFTDNRGGQDKVPIKLQSFTLAGFGLDGYPTAALKPGQGMPPMSGQQPGMGGMAGGLPQQGSGGALQSPYYPNPHRSLNLNSSFPTDQQQPRSSVGPLPRNSGGGSIGQQAYPQQGSSQGGSHGGRTRGGAPQVNTSGNGSQPTRPTRSRGATSRARYQYRL
mmetsp:Transcript_46192/g.90974  ORF Transcript_46192/g.90974 Transcript_46192/m.90974 type:complete len:1578 (-) Transcript_46192:107-4840(-)